MIVKLPACYDVSHHKEIRDFQLVHPKPVLFITKATEAHPGSIYIDTDRKFQRFFSGMMEIEVVRGCYHFHRKSLNPYRQAEHFINTISKMDILPTDFLILDVEEGGERASQLWAWFKTVKDAFPENRQLLYSRKNILDPIYMTTGEKEFFKKILTWTAGYPYFPDLYVAIPQGYIPDQSKYGPSVLWQYTAHGRVDGIITELGYPTDVDMNLIDPVFYSTLGSNVGVTTMADFRAVAKQDAKVWKDVGGLHVATIKKDEVSYGDSEKTVSGTTYLHITTPGRIGWTKKEWFTVTYIIEPEPPPPPPPPPPDPEPVTKTHSIDVFSDGRISVDGGPAF